jgi:hypothetical protein
MASSDAARLAGVYTRNLFGVSSAYRGCLERNQR